MYADHAAIDLLQVVRQLKDQPELARHFIVPVVEHRERKLLEPDELSCVLRKLGRNSHERTSGRLDVGQCTLQSCQLRTAVGSPLAAIEADHQGTASQHLLRADGVAVRVGKAELRRGLPDAQSAVRNP
jgi:hypothetical protein